MAEKYTCFTNKIKKIFNPKWIFWLFSNFYSFLCYSSNHGNSICESLVTVLTCLRSGDKLYRIKICLCEQVLLCLYKKSFLLFILSFVPFIERKKLIYTVNKMFHKICLFRYACIILLLIFLAIFGLTQHLK